MNREYINWLETLPHNRRQRRVNVWMSDWAPLPDHIDLSHLQETQEKWIERDCHDGVMGRIKRIVGRQ